METFNSRTVFTSPVASFYRTVSTDPVGREWCFYLAVIVSKGRYFLTEKEGELLEAVLRKNYDTCGSDGVECALIEFSSSCASESFH